MWFLKKAMENVRKNRNRNLVTTAERGRNYLVSKPNYHTIKFFKDFLLAIKTSKAQIIVSKTCLFRFINIRTE